MTPITLVMAYYENASMLMRQYENLLALDDKLRDLLHVVIVDDGSQKAPAQPVDLHGMSLQIYRMRKDIRWNQDACRNIGVRHAETNWVMLTDIDHLVPANTWKVLLTGEWDDRCAYTFQRVSAPDLQPYKPHPNSWMMTRKMYDAAGGYDERFAGYYGTDSDFRNRLSEVAKFAQMKCRIIRVPRTVIPDASTTNYLRKQPEDGEAITRIKRERAADADPTPRRFTVEYDRVFP